MSSRLRALFEKVEALELRARSWPVMIPKVRSTIIVAAVYLAQIFFPFFFPFPFLILYLFVLFYFSSFFFFFCLFKFSPFLWCMGMRLNFCSLDTHVSLVK